MLVAGEPLATGAIALVAAPVLYVACELLSLALGTPVVPALLTGTGGRGRLVPSGGDGGGLYGPEGDRGGEMVDSSAGGVDYGGGDFGGGGGGDGGGGG